MKVEVEELVAFCSHACTNTSCLGSLTFNMKSLLCTKIINISFIKRPHIGSHGFEKYAACGESSV